MSSPPPGPFANPAATWNQRYGIDGYLFGTEPNGWLARHGGIWSRGQRVLCVADGEGRNSVFLAGLACEVTAFDPSEVGLAKARALAAERGVTVDCRVSSVDEWRWEPASQAEAFDAVVAIFVQFATPAQRAAMFAGFGRALRPGGLLLLVGYGPRQMTYRTGGPGILEHLYDEPMLREAFAGWRIERLHRAQRTLSEGAGHDGMSDVIELLARRP
jgi:SAM-dependent methyltransferase